MAVLEKQKKLDIREAQKFLHMISKHNSRVPTVVPNGVFDDETRAAVKAFQNEYGISPTGTIDNATWEALYEAYKEALMYFSELESILPVPNDSIPIAEGNAGYAIYIIQAMLNTISQFYDNMTDAPISGIYDRKTADSVKCVQRVNGQEPTGVIDENTWNGLAKLYNSHAAMDEKDFVPLEEKKEEEPCQGCVG